MQAIELNKQGPVLLSVVLCKEQLMWGVLVAVDDDLPIPGELSCCFSSP